MPNNTIIGRNSEQTVLAMFNKWSGDGDAKQGQFRRSGYGQKGADLILKSDSKWNWPYILEVKNKEYRPEQLLRVYAAEIEAKEYHPSVTWFIYRYRGRVWAAMSSTLLGEYEGIWGPYPDVVVVTSSGTRFADRLLTRLYLFPLKELLDYMEEPGAKFNKEK